MVHRLIPARLPLMVIVTLTVVAAACGSDVSLDTGSAPEIARCAPEPVRFSAPDDHYRDEPVYVGNNQPTEELASWAQTKPGFEELWIDRDRNGWVTLGFSSDAEARQAELEQEFPDVGVVAVEVPVSNAELEALRVELEAALNEAGIDSWGMGHSVSVGRVSVDLPVLDEANLAPLQPFADQPLCVSGRDPADAVADGPQPTEGEGWRLLDVERTGEPYRTGVATTADQYDALWATAGLTGEAPAVGFETEIVVWFGAVYGSGCEIRMDDVVVDSERAIVHGDFVIPGNPAGCNDDANPESYVVAVDRAVLPVGAFAVQLRADDPPAGVPEERTLVSVDLTPPGSTAADDEIGPDPALVNAVDRGYVVTAGGVLEPGFGAVYDLDLACDFALLGPFNGVVWQAESEGLGPDNPPSGWLDAASDGVLETQLLLAEDPPLLTVMAGGHHETYVPAAAESATDCP